MAFPEGKIEFWSKSVGSSKLEFNKDKKYFTAQRVNITIKDNSDSNKSEKNSYHDINFIVLREVLVDPSSSKMIPQSMKELLQDEFNDANITFESRLEVELTTDFRIYEGNIPVNKNIKESNVVCADTEYQGNERWPKNESKNFDSIDDYAKSQLRGVQPYISSDKTLEDFEKNNGLTPIDSSNSIKTKLNVNGYETTLTTEAQKN